MGSRYGGAVSALAMAGWVAGCALVFATDVRPSPETIGARGLDSLERQGYAAAFHDLVWVYTNFPERSVGRHALLALGAAELDPRNPGQRLHAGVELLRGFLRMEGNPPWTDPVAGSLYHLALELGATQDQVVRAERERARAEEAARLAEARAARAEREARQARARLPAPPPPAAPAPPVPADAREAIAEAAQLRAERDRLRSQVAALERELDETRDELARMRRALRP